MTMLMNNASVVLRRIARTFDDNITTPHIRRYYDWLMSPAGQSIGAKVNSLQSPANRTFTPDPRIPKMDSVRLIKYDFEKYGKAAERKRLLDRWQREVESLPR